MRRWLKLFNSATPFTVHIDLNSCFASCEQQANPFLRDKPVAVCAYTTPSGCVLAASYEAKALGIKTGMRLSEAKILCPKIIALNPDPPKYRYVHKKLNKLLKSYSSIVVAKSIDEFVFDLKDYCSVSGGDAFSIVTEIKRRIKEEIGDYLRVSAGISTNSYLAKLAATLKKPDGLTIIDSNNFEDIYKKIKLFDLPGIKSGNTKRLSGSGISTVCQMYSATPQKLKFAMRSIAGYYWYFRLKGYEVENTTLVRKSFGNSYSLPRPLSSDSDLLPILNKLVFKTSSRVRRAGFTSSGLHLGLLTKNSGYWHKGVKLSNPLVSSFEYQEAFKKIFLERPSGAEVRLISVTAFNLSRENGSQLSLLEKSNKEVEATKVMDLINKKFGSYTITPARLALAKDSVHDRIGFGNVDGF